MHLQDVNRQDVTPQFFMISSLRLEGSSTGMGRGYVASALLIAVAVWSLATAVSPCIAGELMMINSRGEAYDYDTFNGAMRSMGRLPYPVLNCGYDSQQNRYIFFNQESKVFNTFDPNTGDVGRLRGCEHAESRLAGFGNDRLLGGGFADMTYYLARSRPDGVSQIIWCKLPTTEGASSETGVFSIETSIFWKGVFPGRCAEITTDPTSNSLWVMAEDATGHFKLWTSKLPTATGVFNGELRIDKPRMRVIRDFGFLSLPIHLAFDSEGVLWMASNQGSQLDRLDATTAAVKYTTQLEHGFELVEMSSFIPRVGSSMPRVLSNGLTDSGIRQSK